MIVCVYCKEEIGVDEVARETAEQLADDVDAIGYAHTVMKGSSSVEVAQQLVHVHRVFSNLKTWLNGTHHGVSAKHLQAYLNEYAFRYNRRRKPMAAFQRLLGLGSHLEGPTYEGLYATGRRGAWRHPNTPGRPERTG